MTWGGVAFGCEPRECTVPRREEGEGECLSMESGRDREIQTQFSKNYFRVKEFGIF